MKTKFISVLLVFLLSISIAGCSDNKSRLNSSNNTSTSGNKPSDTSDPASSLDSSGNTKAQNSALEAYKAVLQNKTAFFSTDNKRNISLNDFLSNKVWLIVSQVRVIPT